MTLNLKPHTAPPGTSVQEVCAIMVYGTALGVPMIRIVVFRGLYCVPTIFGESHMSTRPPSCNLLPASKPGTTNKHVNPRPQTRRTYKPKADIGSQMLQAPTLTPNSNPMPLPVSISLLATTNWVAVKERKPLSMLWVDRHSIGLRV